MTNNPYQDYSYSPDPQAGQNPYDGSGSPQQWPQGPDAASTAYGQAVPGEPDASGPPDAPGYAGGPGHADGPDGGGRRQKTAGGKRMRRWATPLIVGVFAFTIGVAAGAGGDTEEVASAGDLDAEIEAAVAEVEEERDALAAELAEVESERAGFAGELEGVTAERDDIAGDIDDARAERDEALERVEAIEAENEEARAAAEAEAEAAEPSASFGNGTWRVGEDIDPGTYRTDGGSGCYWERLSGFSGEFGDIISNDFLSGPSTVTIQEGDAGFASQGCGTWELME